MQNKSFDDLLENKIGFGKYQYFCILTLGFIHMNEGVHQSLVANLNQVFKKQFDMSSEFTKIMIFISYLGMFIGSTSAGFLSNIYGRWIVLFINSIIHYLSGLSQIFISNKYELLAIRIIYGISYGMCLGLVSLTVTETTPLKYRGRCLITLNYFMTIGAIYTILILEIFMTSFSEGNWKMVIIACTAPNILVPFLMWFFLYESPRFLIVRNKIEQAIPIINKMGRRNNKEEFEEITEKEIKNLKVWRESLYKNKQNVKYSELFQKSTFKITWRIFYSYSTFTITGVSLDLINPLIYQSDNKNFISLLWGPLGQVPAIFLAFYLVEKKNFGRKSSVLLFYSLAGLSVLMNLLLINFKYIYVYQYTSMIHSFFYKCSLVFTIIMCQESFPTHIRSLGSSSAIGLGQLMNSLTPFYIYDLFHIWNILPMIYVVGLYILVTIVMSSFPIDLTGKQLEDVRKSIIKMDNQYVDDQSQLLVSEQLDNLQSHTDSDDQQSQIVQHEKIANKNKDINNLA